LVHGIIEQENTLAQVGAACRRGVKVEVLDATKSYQFAKGWVLREDRDHIREWLCLRLLAATV